MALQFGEHVRTQALATLHDPRHREAGVVIQDRSRHAAEKTEGRDMTVAEGFRCLSRIRFDEAAVRMRQVHAKVVEPYLPARDEAIGLAKIRLSVTRAMAQRHEHLARSQRRRRHIFPHNRIAAGKSPLIPETLKYPLRRVALLLVHPAIGLEEGVDPRRLRAQLLRGRPLTPPVAGRNRILKHLRDRVPVNAKPRRHLTSAQPVHHHRPPDPGIEFHCEHPSGPSMPGTDIKKAYQDRYTLAPPSRAGSPPVQWYNLRPLFIQSTCKSRPAGGFQAATAAIGSSNPTIFSTRRRLSASAVRLNSA